MQEKRNRLDKAEKADHTYSGKTQSHLPETSNNFEVAKTFYPNEDDRIMRRYSLDDNGGGYLGL